MQKLIVILMLSFGVVQANEDKTPCQILNYNKDGRSCPGWQWDENDSSLLVFHCYSSQNGSIRNHPKNQLILKNFRLKTIQDILAGTDGIFFPRASACLIVGTHMSAQDIIKKYQ